jgi:hypothetical protein
MKLLSNYARLTVPLSSQDKSSAPLKISWNLPIIYKTSSHFTKHKKYVMEK